MGQQCEGSGEKGEVIEIEKKDEEIKREGEREFRG
jgi:hypothetical protein